MQQMTLFDGDEVEAKKRPKKRKRPGLPCNVSMTKGGRRFAARAHLRHVETSFGVVAYTAHVWLTVIPGDKRFTAKMQKVVRRLMDAGYRSVHLTEFGRAKGQE